MTTTASATSSATTTAASTISSTGSSILTTLGVGSGVNTSDLIAKLVAAEKDPQEQLLTNRTSANTARITALGNATSGIDSFASALASLVSGGTLFTQATSSDTGVAAVTALAGSRIDGLSSTVEVEQLAQGQTLTAAAVPGAGAAIGTGSFTLANAGQTRTITIDASNNSLTGLAKAINASNVGVSASILTDTTGARLVLKGASGANYGFTMSLDAGSDGALGMFAYPASGGSGLTRQQAAQDARIKVDGVEVTRPTNSISDAIAGVKIDLKKAAPGTTLAIGSSFPSDAISQTVSNFVAAYNELKTTLDAATAAAASDGTAGVGALRGDPGVRSMQQQLQRLTSTPLTSSGTGPKTLAELGVSTQRDGSLKLDATVLAAKLASDPAGVAAMFNPTQSSDNSLIQITSAMGKAKPGSYTLTDIAAGPPPSGRIGGVDAVVSGDSLIAAASSSAVGLVLKPLGDVASATITVEPGLAGALQLIRDTLRATQGPLAATQTRLANETKSISADQEKLETRIAAYQKQLTTQFTKMDSTVTALNATRSYLEQQIKLWTNGNS